MIKPARLNELLGISESYKSPEAMMSIIYDRDRLVPLMKSVLEETDYNVDIDMFREYFESEHADRKVKKQDFTPPSVAKLTAALVGTSDTGMFYEPCAGTGGMTIAQWDQDRRNHSPFDYKPSWYFYACEELSDRALPFLLFNLALRGMNALVVQCDVLSRKAYGAFFVQNDNDDHMQFSSINRLPYSKQVEDYLAVKFVEERYAPLLQSPAEFWKLPAFEKPTPRGHVSDFTKAFYTLCGVPIVVEGINQIQPTVRTSQERLNDHRGTFIQQETLEQMTLF